MTRSLLAERLEDRRLLSADAFPMHNPLVPTDVTGDWETTPMDALVVINYLNRQSAQTRGASEAGGVSTASNAVAAGDGPYLDTNADNNITPQDALGVINELNAAEGAPGDKVTYRIDALDLAGNPLPRDAQGRVHLTVGQDFRFQSYVQDSQGNPIGLFSAYLDTGYLEVPDQGVDQPGADLFAVVIGETQRLSLNSATFSNGTGTFRLNYTKPGAAVGTWTSPITVEAAKNATSANIKAALEGLGADGPGMVEVTRDAVDGNAPVWYIRFVGSDRGQDVPVLQGDFSGLSTPTGHTIDDNFHPADPNDAGAFRIAFTVNDLFKNSKTAFPGSADEDGDSGTNPNWQSEFDEIGGTSGLSSYPDGEAGFEYSLIGSMLTALEPGTITFQANATEKTGSETLLISGPVDNNDIDFGRALVFIVTKPVNAEDDAFSVVEDIPQDLDVLKLSAADGTAGKDFLEDGSTGVLALDSVDQPAHGTTSIVAGKVHYVPFLNYNGPDTFTYTATDGQGNFDTATVTIDVTPVNDAPDATDATFTVDEDGDPATDPENVFDLSPFFSDIDGDVVSIVGLGPAGNQSQIQTPHGTATLVAGQVEYQSDADFFGQDTFEYTVSDGQATDKATITVNVTSVNDAPTAVDDVRTIAEDPATPLVIDVIANDSPGPLEDGVDSLTVTSPLVTGPDQGGTVNIVNNKLEYTPAGNFFGDETFEYEVQDNGGLTATAWVTVHVTSVDDPPTAVDDAANVEEFSTDNPLPVLINDWPGEVGDLLEDRGAMFIVQVGPTSNGGSVRIDPADNTQLLYSPPTGLAWSPTEEFTDTFTYTMSDTVQAGNHEQSALVTVTLDPAIRPRARADQRSLDEDSLAGDAGTALGVTANDLFNNGADPTTRTLQITRQPLHGTATVIGTGATLDVQYVPNGNYEGPDSLQYEITDALGGNDPDSQAARLAEVTITVNDVNDDPVATDNAFTVLEDSNPVTDPANVFNVVVDDNSGVDTGETLIVVGLGLGAGPHTATTITTAQGATATLQADGTIQYTPSADFFNDQGGPLDTFQYTIRDRAVGDPEGLTATATVTVTVQNVNDNPVATNNAFTVQEDSDPATDAPNTFDVQSDDNSGPDPAETLTVIGLGPGNQAMITTAQGATVELLANGDIEYKPAGDWFNDIGGRPVDTFTYTLRDDGGLTDTATVSVTVENVNDDPTATPDTGSDAFLGLKDFADQTLDVLGNDSIAPDINETLTIIGLGLPGDPINSQTITTPYGTATIAPDGLSVIYATAGVQDVTDTFFYQISDGNGGTADAQADVDIVDAVPANISGTIYLDVNNNGQRDPQEIALAGVTVMLSGTNLRGNPVDATVTTNLNGVFEFANVLPNAVEDTVGYTIRANTPAFLLDGLDGVVQEMHTGEYDSGVVGNDVISGIRLGLYGTNAAEGNYMFGERGLSSQYISLGQYLASSQRGLALATSMAGDDYWFSVMQGWDGIESAHVQLSDDLTTATLTIVDTAGHSQTRTLTYRDYSLAGDRTTGQYMVYFRGSAADLGFTLPGEGELAEGEAPVRGDAEMMATDSGSEMVAYAQDVDAIFGDNGWA